MHFFHLWGGQLLERFLANVLTQKRDTFFMYSIYIFFIMKVWTLFRVLTVVKPTNSWDMFKCYSRVFGVCPVWVGGVNCSSTVTRLDFDAYSSVCRSTSGESSAVCVSASWVCLASFSLTMFACVLTGPHFSRQCRSLSWTPCPQPPRELWLSQIISISGVESESNPGRRKTQSPCLSQRLVNTALTLLLLQIHVCKVVVMTFYGNSLCYA